MKIICRPPSRNTTAFSGVNVLILLALALCGLIGWQWKRETSLFTENRKLKADILSDHETKHQQVKSIENLQNEINRLEIERKNSGAVARTNRDLINDLARRMAALESDLRAQSNSTIYFKTAFEHATNQVRIANSNMIRANELLFSMRKSVDDRNEVASRLNDMNKKYAELMTERNEIVDKFNGFVKEVEAERKKEKK